MKKTAIILCTLFALLLAFTQAQAKTITSSDELAQVNIARVSKLIQLEQQGEVQVQVVSQDLGGSTDISPSQNIFLTLYLKGEMFSTDAAFKLGAKFELKSAEVLKPGVYKITVLDFEQTDTPKGFVDLALTVDARKAIEEIQKVDCGFEFDCSASEDFVSTVELTK